MTQPTSTPAKTASPARRKPRKFSRQAKTIVSAAAVTALIGGWNLIAHLDNAQATDAMPQPVQNDAAVLQEFHLNTPTPNPWPTLAPLQFAAVPTLAPRTALPSGGVTSAAQAGSVQLPAMALLAPLPDLAPLPSMPSLPPPPNGGGGGSNNGGGGNGGATTSGGS
jgi:hypothetical protein